MLKPRIPPQQYHQPQQMLPPQFEQQIDDLIRNTNFENIIMNPETLPELPADLGISPVHSPIPSTSREEVPYPPTTHPIIAYKDQQPIKGRQSSPVPKKKNTKPAPAPRKRMSGPAPKTKARKRMSSPAPKTKARKRMSSPAPKTKNKRKQQACTSTKRKPGRPKGSVSQPKIQPLTIVHPVTGEDFAQMQCSLMGDARQNRDNVIQYRVLHPEYVFDKLDQQNSGVVLKSARTR